MLEIVEVTKEDVAALDQVKALFREYANWLSVDLSFQGFEEELSNLPEPAYVAPEGALFLARVNGLPAGCVAVRQFEN